MEAIKLENGNLLIPKRAVSDDENPIIGDGIEEITPDDPEYEKWLPFVRAEGEITY